MGSLTLTMLIVFVIGLICIAITPKSPVEAASSWECDTCGAGNPSTELQCDQCAMERPA